MTIPSLQGANAAPTGVVLVLGETVEPLALVGVFIVVSGAFLASRAEKT